MSTDGVIPQSCKIRVHLLGPLDVSLRSDDGTWAPVERTAWGKGQYARSVLKCLLCAPARRASRSRLLDDLWPNTEIETADHYLYTAIYHIRRVLGEAYVRTKGSIYELADQARLWVDLDACRMLLREAEDLDHPSEQALPLLEQALSYLERGECLEGESGLWCYPDRKESEDMLRQCRLWLAERYEAQGKVWQAGEQYRALLQNELSDEEALCSWMGMLHRHGKNQEALKCFNDVKTHFEQQGAHLSPEIEKRILNRNKPLSFMAHPITSEGNLPTSPAPSHTFQHEEILLTGETDIPLCWTLYFEGHLSAVQRLLFPTFLPQLVALIPDLKLQKRAAPLASKATLLAAVMEMHHQNLGNALIYTKQGVAYGEIAEDLNLQIASLIQQGNIYFALKQSWHELDAFQQAYHVFEMASSNTISPLLASRVFIGLAKAYAKIKEEQKALHFLDMAHEQYPQHPEADPAFSYTCHTHFTLNNHTGLTYLNLGQYDSANKVFAALDEILPQTLVPRRMELLNRQAAIFLALREMQTCCTTLEKAVHAARTLGSDLRLNEAYELYLNVEEQWKNERQIKALGQLFKSPQ